MACLSLMERTDDYRELFGKKRGIVRDAYDKKSVICTDLSINICIFMTIPLHKESSFPIKARSAGDDHLFLMQK